jgi:ParB family chromosome partitioning protein
MVKKQKLGRGLDALLASNAEEVQDGDVLSNISITKLQRGKFQPRNEIDPSSLKELTESIRSQGVIQPIIVRQIGENYEIIAGERRFRAAKLAGLGEMPAIIRPMSDDIALAIGLIENIQREALTPLEEAKALEKLTQDFKMTHAKVSEIVGRSRSAVSNLIRLLQLNAGVKQMLHNAEIEMGHGRCLLALDDNIQLEIAKEVVDKSLSVRQTENLVKKTLNPPVAKSTPILMQDLSQDISNNIGCKTKITINDKGKGKIGISFNTKDELDNIINKLK